MNMCQINEIENLLLMNMCQINDKNTLHLHPHPHPHSHPHPRPMEENQKELEEQSPKNAAPLSVVMP